MEQLRVVVKPEHLRGNTWYHGSSKGDGKRCPLEKALVAAGFPDADVGASRLWLYGEPDSDFFLAMSGENNEKGLVEIDWSWRSSTVTEIIEEANDGSEQEYVLEMRNGKLTLV